MRNIYTRKKIKITLSIEKCGKAVRFRLGNRLHNVQQRPTSRNRTLGKEQRDSAMPAVQRRIIMDCGNGNSRRHMDVSNTFSALESKQVGLAAALPAMHTFTECDYTSAFYRKCKMKPLDILENDMEGVFVQYCGNMSNV